MVRPNTLILRETEDGKLRDAQGNFYNAEGQRVDAEGTVIPEEIPRHEEQPRHEEPPPLYNGGLQVHTLADYNRPDRFYANRSAIRPPAYERNDFEIKLQYYTYLGQNQFHGLPNEHPMDHLERFEDIVAGIKANGVSSDYLHCKLFPHSLAGDALNWLNSLPPGSLTTWEETRRAFLVYFYDDAKSEELRSKISSFKQAPTEAFKAAWIRFKKYQRDCPHHGFTEPQLLSTFFKGVDWMYQVSLDSASNGNFMTRSPQSAMELIHNLTQSNSTKKCDEERARKGAAESTGLAEVKASLNSIQNMLKKTVSFVEEEEEVVNFVGGNGYMNNYKNGDANQGGYASNQQFHKPTQNNGYKRTYGDNEYQNPPKTDPAITAMFEKLLEGQNKQTGDFNGKIDNMYTEFNAKFDAIHSHMKKLDTQVAQVSEAVKRQEGFLPGKSEKNPRQHCNAISTRSRKAYETTYANQPSQDDAEEFDELYEEAISSQQGPVSTDTVTHVGRHSLPSENCGYNIDRHTKPVSTDSTPVDRHTPSVARHNPQMDQNPPNSKQAKPEPIYKTKIPYPKLPKMSKKEIEEAKCKDILDQLSLRIPFFDACKMAPTLRSYVKKMLSNNLSIEEGIMMITETCSEMIQAKMPKKLEDTGSFVLNCKIGDKTFERSLCDIGSAVNLMPYTVAKKLGMTDFVETSTVLVLADRSVRIPKGLLEDVPVKIGDVWIPADFIVLDYDKNEPKDPIILGRPFLATAGALIDCKIGRIELRLEDKTIVFDMDNNLKKPTIDGQSFMVETLGSATDKVVKEMDEKVCYFKEEKQKNIDQPELTKTTAAPTTAIQQKAPDIAPQTPLLKQRYAHSNPNFASHPNISGKHSVPPRHRAHPGSIPTFLGRSHAPNAYTPPWMRRISTRHSLPLSKPPDI